MKKARLLLSFLSVWILLSGTTGYAQDSSSLAKAQNIAVQNMQLTQDLQKLRMEYSLMENKGWENAKKSVAQYEKEKKELARVGNSDVMPGFGGTGVTPPPLTEGYIQSVRFTAKTPAGEPVCNLMIEIQPISEDAKEGMQRLAGEDFIGTSSDGSLTRRLYEGDYLLTMSAVLNRKTVEKSQEIRVEKQVGVQEIPLIWEEMTPTQAAQKLPNRLEILLQDPDGNPVPGILGVFDTYDGAAVIPTTYTDAQGMLILPMPQSQEGSLVFTNHVLSDDYPELFLDQSVSITLKTLKGVRRATVIWDPQETPNPDFENAPAPAPEPPDFSALSDEQLAAKLSTLEAENLRLRGEVDALLDKWDLLETETSQYVKQEKERIDALYRAAAYELPLIEAGSDTSKDKVSSTSKTAERTLCTFTARDEAGNPIPNLTLEFLPRFTPPEGYFSYESHDRTDADGRMVVSLCPGEYVLRVSDPKQSYGLGSQAPVQEHALTVKAPGQGGEYFAITWKSQTPDAYAKSYEPKVVIRFTDENDTPLPNLFVRLDYQKNESSPEYGNVAGGYTNRDGTYTYLNPLEKEIALFVQDGSSSRRFRVSLRDLSGTREVDIRISSDQKDNPA